MASSKSSSGFLERDIKQHEPDENQTLEEQYEKLFAKIGRDFVTREDLERILHNLIVAISPIHAGMINTHSDTEARRKAFDYKNTLDNNLDGTELYTDLIEPDDQ